MLEKELEKLNQVHDKTEEMLDNASSIPGSLLNEYRRGVEQYTDMYRSIEAFKESCSEEAKESFLLQQTRIIQNWIQYELNVQEKLVKKK